METARPLPAELSANRLFDATLSAISDFAYTFDRQGRFLYANKALLDLWGLRLADAVGKNFFDLSYPADLAARLQRQIQEVIERKEIVRDVTPYLSPTGVYGVYEYIFAPVFNDSGEVEIVAGSTRDITRHKQIETELRESQHRMEAALDGGKTGTWVWNVVENQARFDRNVANIFSLNPDELASGTPMERVHAAIHPEDRERVTQTLRTAAASASNYHSEYRVMNPAGQIRWIVSRGNVHKDSEGRTTSVTGTVTDISERQQAERDLHFLSELSLQVSALTGVDEITARVLENLVQHLNVQRAYFFEALPKTDRVLVTQNWNRPGVSSIAGEYDHLQFGTPGWWAAVQKKPVTVNDTEIVPNVDAERYAAIHIRAWVTVPYAREGNWVAGIAVSSGEPRVWTRAEVDLLSDVMARIWPMIERARIGIVMKANQAMLARQRDILEKVAQDSPLNEILSDLARDFEQSTGRPVMTAVNLGNEAEPTSSKLSRERIIVPDLEHASELPELPDVMLRAPVRAYWSTPIKSRLGTVLGTFIVGYPQPSSPRDQEIAGCDLLVRTAAIAIERDRARKALEDSGRELAKANEELEKRVHERTSRLKETIEELESFSYSISHDLRAPLRAMQGYAAVLLEEEGASSSAVRRDYLERIKRASERLDHLINDILRYTRVARAEVTLQPVDLNLLIKDGIREYPQLHDKSVNIEVQVLPLVMGHPVLLNQCLTNLLINAVKFVSPGIAPRVKISSETIDGRVKIWIEDNGIGIEEKNLARIFGMFERVNPIQVFEGTGIGLTIVKRSMERMEGSLGVESTFGKGSRFWLELPAA